MRERLDQAYVDVVELVWRTTDRELSVQAKCALRARLELHIALATAAGINAVVQGDKK